MAAEPVNIPHPQSEFWTVVTDFVLSAACAFFALRLQRRIRQSCDKKPSPPSSKLRAVAAAAGGSIDAARWWARVLWVIALSTLLAALYLLPLIHYCIPVYNSLHQVPLGRRIRARHLCSVAAVESSSSLHSRRRLLHVPFVGMHV
jgi:hypothetical protein